MPNTPNTEIPYVPEGTLDPAAGLNDALNVIDALLQPRVISIGDNAPPSTGADGDMYIVGTSPTGDWAGHPNELARYVLEGQFWQFYTPGVQVQTVINDQDSVLYVYDTVNSPNSWGTVQAGSSTAPVSTLSGTSYSLGDLTNGTWHLFDAAGAVTLEILDEGSEPIEPEAEFGVHCMGAGGLTILTNTDAVIIPPRGGTLVLEDGDFVLIKRIAVDTYKVIGESVAEGSP